ncbi:calcium-binding protein [Gammaproteobacteria bacterium]|nr:calcium-binding protein [Gammaproteobacteria bacterium]
MAFITAATRSDIVELAMGMLNKAPSTTMLNTLVEKSSAGSTIQDLADYIATTDEFIAEYPSTQTAREFATEMFAKLITGGTLDAAINTAVIDLLEGMLTAGTTKAEGFVAVIDYLSNTANNTNADLGDISKSFQNRADAAEYFSITKELGGSTDAELAAAIATVTSDAATLTAANASADATEAVVAIVPGTTYTLTTGTDFVGGTPNNDLINAVRAGSGGVTETYSPVDQVAGGAGVDTLYAETDAATISLATVTGVENIQINAAGTGGTTVTLPNDKAYAELHSLNSIDNLTFNAIQNADVNGSIIASANGKTTTYNYHSTALTSATDNLDVQLSAADGDLDITGGTAANALETLTLNSVSDSELDDIDLNGANTTKLVITGSGATSITGISNAAATLNTIDASAATGAVTVTGVNATSNTITGGTGNDTLAGAGGNDVITGGTGADKITGGAGNDNLDGGAGNDTIVLASATKDDTVAGGEGTDILSLGTAVSYSATVNSGVGITGFETLSATGDLTQNMLGLAGNTIDTAVIGATGADLVMQGSAVTTVAAPFSGGSLIMGLATDGAADALAISLGSVVGSTASTLGLSAVDIETMTVNSVGADTNTLTLGDTTAGSLGVASTTSTGTDLTKLTLTGDKSLTVTSSAKSLSLATVDATNFAGTTLQVTASGSTAAMTVTAAGAYSAIITSGKGADTITVGDGGTANSNTVSGGDGADTIVSGAGADELNGGDDGGSITAGAGNDTVSSGDGVDTIILGEGDDTVSDSGAANDVITGGAGNDTVTSAGAGNDSIDGGTGNDNLTGGSGADTIIGGEGNDTLNGGTGNDVITGGAGNDVITDGDGDDVVTGGAGNDTVTVSAGSDNIDTGEGNDSITITGLTSADTIDGGTGTDTLTVTNSSSSTVTPSFVGIENLVINTSTTFAIDFTSATDKTSTKTFTITGTDSGGTDDVTVTNAPSGSSFTISDDLTWDGASATDTNDTGDIDEVTLDMVAGADVSVTIAANADSATKTATTLATNLEIGDAATVSLTGSGGIAAAPLVHNITAFVLDDTETRTVTVTAPAYTGMDIGAVSQAAGVQSFTFTSAAGADSDMTTFASPTALNSLTLSATGTASTLNSTTIGNTTTAVLTSLDLSANDAGNLNMGAITSSGADAMTSVSVKTTGANSTVDHDAINLGASAVATFNLDIASNSTLASSGSTITMGTVAAGTISVGDYATIGTGGATTVDAEYTALTLNIGQGVTYTNQIALTTQDTGTTKLTVNINSGAAAIDYNTATANQLKVATVRAYDITEASFEQMVINFNGTGAIKWTAASQTTGLSIAGANQNDSLTGGAGNDSLTGNGGNDTLAGGDGVNNISGGDGDDAITSGTGNDILTGGNGADTITAGSGNDTITLTEDAQGLDDVKISNGGSADAVTQATTAGGDDTGADTITGFDAGASADSITLVTATGVGDFDHTSADVSFGGGTTSASSTGIIADFSTSALIFDFNSDGDAIDDNTDLVINMNSLTIDGVAVTSTTRATALTNIKADLAYNLTAGATADTIIGGDQADTIALAAGVDVVTGGAGNDTISLGASDTDTDTVNIAFGGAGVDFISEFEVGASGDKIDLTGTTDVNDAAGGATMDADGFIIYDTAASDDVSDGLYIIDNNNNLKDMITASTYATAAEVATYLADVSTGGGTDKISMNAATDVAYIIVGDGTYATLAKVTGGADTTIDTADVTLIAHFNLADTGTIHTNQFPDFAG